MTRIAVIELILRWSNILQLSMQAKNRLQVCKTAAFQHKPSFLAQITVCNMTRGCGIFDQGV